MLACSDGYSVHGRGYGHWFGEFGSPKRAVTDQNGAVTDTYDYDAFGVLTHSTGSSPNTTLFAGEQYDRDLGLYFNLARYLNTSTGRFDAAADWLFETCRVLLDALPGMLKALNHREAVRRK